MWSAFRPFCPGKYYGIIRCEGGVRRCGTAWRRHSWEKRVSSRSRGGGKFVQVALVRCDSAGGARFVGFGGSTVCGISRSEKEGDGVLCE